jgi:hypothetical protein
MRIKIRQRQVLAGDGVAILGPVPSSKTRGSIRPSKMPPPGKLSARRIQIDPARIRELAKQAIGGELHFEDAAIKIDIDGSGIKLTNKATGNFSKMYPGGSFTVYNPDGSTRDVTIDPYDGSIKVINGAVSVANGTKSITLDADGITMTDTAGAGKSLTLSFAALMEGKAVSLRVDDYCDGTTAKSQQHMATAPYV